MFVFDSCSLIDDFGPLGQTEVHTYTHILSYIPPALESAVPSSLHTYWLFCELTLAIRLHGTSSYVIPYGNIGHFFGVYRDFQATSKCTQVYLQSFKDPGHFNSPFSFSISHFVSIFFFKSKKEEKTRSLRAPFILVLWWWCAFAFMAPVHIVINNLNK